MFYERESLKFLIYSMKTKFILHGGYNNHDNEINQRFYQECLKDLPGECTVLLVYFARYGTWGLENIEKDKQDFIKNNPDKKINFIIATEEDLEKQIKQANVVYLDGGKTFQLLKTLKQFKNLRKWFKGKTIIGSSAGAYALSVYFYSETEGGLSEGLGYVPVKIICHCLGENSEKLNEVSHDLETLLLPDYQYKVFEI